jgi:hypothetical protein
VTAVARGAFNVGPIQIGQGFIIALFVLTAVILIVGYRFKTRNNKYKGNS